MTLSNSPQSCPKIIEEPQQRAPSRCNAVAHQDARSSTELVS